MNTSVSRARLSPSPVEMGTLGTVVAERLRNMILTGELNDGDRIVERDLSEAFGVSRGPIRDALRELEAEGLVILLPRRGARIASLSLSDAIEVIGIREALEPLAVRFMLERGDPASLAALRARLDSLQEAAEKEDWPGLVLLDMEFHAEIYHQAQRRRLERIWETLRAPLLQTFRLHRNLYPTPKAVYDSHVQLYAELASGNIEQAAQAARAHVTDPGSPADVLR